MKQSFKLNVAGAAVSVVQDTALRYDLTVEVEWKGWAGSVSFSTSTQALWAKVGRSHGA